MAADLTLLLYTANLIPDDVAARLRAYLLEVTEGQYPVVSVSQRPIDFGRNLCVGEIGASKYNAYKQILIGLRAVDTEFVACVDDDVLYVPEHFQQRPPCGAEGGGVLRVIVEAAEDRADYGLRLCRIEAVQQLKQDVGLPMRLRDLGVEESQLADAARQAAGNSRLMRVNPRLPTTAELEKVLREAW